MIKRRSILKMLIEIDSREPESMEMLAKLVDEKLIFIRKFMDVGDYVNGDVVIERKEINDFCCSMMDGRLEAQVEKMKEKYENCFIIIIGRIKDRTSEIHEHSVLGMIVSLIVKHKIGVIMVDDEFQFMYAMKRIFERYKEIEDEKFIRNELKATFVQSG